MGHPRTALVTGGMGGLGEAIARTLHDAGHTVLVTHSRSDEAASTAVAARMFPLVPAATVTVTVSPAFISTTAGASPAAML